MILVLQNIDNSMHIMDKAMVTITSLGNGGVVWIVLAGIILGLICSKVSIYIVSKINKNHKDSMQFIER